MKQTPLYPQVRTYIDRQWQALTYRVPKDQGVHIGLPNAFVAPSEADGIFLRDQFYWDSYFIILGLLESKKVQLARGMVDNFLYLFKRFGLIPMRNRFYNVGISQPPFLTSMIREVFAATEDVKWVKEATRIAERELQEYWMDNHRRAEHHLAYKNLSRYIDHHYSPHC